MLNILAYRLVPDVGSALGIVERNSGHCGYVGTDGRLRPRVVGGVDGVDMGVLCRGCVGNGDLIESVVKRAIERAASSEHVDVLFREEGEWGWGCVFS